MSDKEAFGRELLEQLKSLQKEYKAQQAQYRETMTMGRQILQQLGYKDKTEEKKPKKRKSKKRKLVVRNCEGSFWLEKDDDDYYTCDEVADKQSYHNGTRYSCEDCKKKFIAWKRKEKSKE